MSKQLLLTLPDDLYADLSQVAASESRALSDVIIERLTPPHSGFYVHPQRAKMQEEIAAYHKLHPQLVKTHFGKTVAVHGGQVVDFDDDPVALLQRIKRRFPSEIVLRRLVEAFPERELRVRSFRYIS